MHTSYPDVTEAELRAQYQKSDQAQARRVLRFLIWMSLPLLYFDWSLLGWGQSFFLMCGLRVAVMVSAWWILQGNALGSAYAYSDRHFLLWTIFALFSQLVGDFLTPLNYLGHFIIDAWICLVISIVVPLRAKHLRSLVLAYLFVATALCLTKFSTSFVHQASVFVMLILSAYTGQALATYIHRFRSKLLSAEFELQRKEITDPLTGVANRREFLRNMDNELQRHSRLGKPLSVLIIEVEQLKQFNLQHGAGTSDMILVEVSKRLQRVTRNYDCLARYGMDEFVVLLPEAMNEIADKIAQRAQSTINSIPIPISGKELKVNGSVGIATMRDGDGIESMLRRAEEDLKRAKLSSDNVLDSDSQRLAYA